MADYTVRKNSLSVTIQQKGDKLMAFSLFRFAESKLLSPPVLPIFNQNAKIQQIYVNSTLIGPENIRWMNFADPLNYQNRQKESFNNLRLQSELFTQISAREKFGDLYVDLSMYSQISVDSVGFVFEITNCRNSFRNLDSVFEQQPQFKFQSSLNDGSLWMPIPLFFMAEQLSFALQFVLEPGFEVCASGLFAGQNKFAGGVGTVHQIYFQIQKQLLFIQAEKITLVFTKSQRISNFQVIKSVFNELLSALQTLEIEVPHLQVIIDGDYDYDQLNQAAANIILFPLLNIPADPSAADTAIVYQFASQSLSQYVKILIPPADSNGVGVSMITENLMKLFFDHLFLPNCEFAHQLKIIQDTFALYCNFAMPPIYIDSKSDTHQYTLNQWKETMLNVGDSGCVEVYDASYQINFGTIEGDQFFQQILNLFRNKLQHNFDQKPRSYSQDALTSQMSQMSQMGASTIGGQRDASANATLGQVAKEPQFTFTLENLLFSDSIWPIISSNKAEKLRFLRAKTAAVFLFNTVYNIADGLAGYLRLQTQSLRSFNSWLSQLQGLEEQTKFEGVGPDDQRYEDFRRREEVERKSANRFQQVIESVNSAQSGVKIIYDLMTVPGDAAKGGRSCFTVRSHTSKLLSDCFAKIQFSRDGQVLVKEYGKGKENTREVAPMSPIEFVLNDLEADSKGKYATIDPELKSPFLSVKYLNLWKPENLNYEKIGDQGSSFFQVFPQFYTYIRDTYSAQMYEKHFNSLQYAAKIVMIRSLFINCTSSGVQEAIQKYIKLAEKENQDSEKAAAHYLIDQLYCITAEKPHQKSEFFSPLNKFASSYEMALFLTLLGYCGQTKLDLQAAFSLIESYWKLDENKNSSNSLIRIACFQSQVWCLLRQDQATLKKRDTIEKIASVYFRLMDMSINSNTAHNTRAQLLGLVTFLFLNLDHLLKDISEICNAVMGQQKRLLSRIEVLSGVERDELTIECTCTECTKSGAYFGESGYDTMFMQHLKLLLLHVDMVEEKEKPALLHIVRQMFGFGKLSTVDLQGQLFIQNAMSKEFILLGCPTEQQFHRYDPSCLFGWDEIQDQLYKQALPYLYDEKVDLKGTTVDGYEQPFIRNCPHCCYGGSCTCRRWSDRFLIIYHMLHQLQNWNAIFASADQVLQPINNFLSKLQKRVELELIKTRDLQSIEKEPDSQQGAADKANEDDLSIDVEVRPLHLAQALIVFKHLTSVGCRKVQIILIDPLVKLLSFQSIAVRKSTISVLEACFGFASYQLFYPEVIGAQLQLDGMQLSNQMRYLRNLLDLHAQANGLERQKYIYADQVFNAFLIHQFGVVTKEDKDNQIGAGFLRLGDVL